MHWLITSWRFRRDALIDYLDPKSSHTRIPLSDIWFKNPTPTDWYYYGYKTHMLFNYGLFGGASLQKQFKTIVERKVFQTLRPLRIKDPDAPWSSVMTLDEWREIHAQIFTNEFISATNPIAGHAGTDWPIRRWYPDMEIALTQHLSIFIINTIFSALLLSVLLMNGIVSWWIWMIWLCYFISTTGGMSEDYRMVVCVLWEQRYKIAATNLITQHLTIDEDPTEIVKDDTV